MGALKKADYYYGALLSVLINGGIAPALFENENESRQIYKITTNRNEYLLYAKYHSSPTGNKEFTWSFSFSDNELIEIQKLKERDECLVFAFICCQKKLNDYHQEIAIVDWEDFIECVDVKKVDYKSTPRLSVKLIKGSRALRIYGSKRSDILNGKDNTLKVDRNGLCKL